MWLLVFCACHFLTMLWVGLQRVIVAFPGHTHLIFVQNKWESLAIGTLR